MIADKSTLSTSAVISDMIYSLTDSSLQVAWIFYAVCNRVFVLIVGQPDCKISG